MRLAYRLVERLRPEVRSDWEGRISGVLGRRSLTRRTVLVAPLVALVGGAAALRSQGPRLDPSTGWTDGGRLTTADGRLLRPDDVPVGGAVAAWPEGNPDSERGAVMLLRLRHPPTDVVGRAHAADGTLVAYSRICTHAGCPVTLFREDDQSLFCPCHQATFDAASGAEPTFGPAPRPLPRLPLGMDSSGYVIARGDLDATPGPTPAES